MIGELGHFSLALALLMSLLLALFPMMGARSDHQKVMQMARPVAAGMFLFTAVAYACLTYSFVTDDFSLSYVAHHSNSLLPLHYKVTAVWGGHEGSFLLWTLIFTLWTLAVSWFSRGIPLTMVARVLSVLGMIGAGFYLFMLWVSDPFATLLPFYPVDGRDLNPLLQDFGMIIHPPMQYMGYVGFSVVFAFAIAALLTGKLDSTWARWSRPWVLAAWGFLTLGMALGSWWAYYELGWGGWWFWDPSENAALMPWLVGTALLHSLAVTEKRKVFKSWTVLLAIAAFSLSLFGTFLIRSGVLVSVHSFASDPSRGLFILGLLVVVIGGSLLLYALRAGSLNSEGRYELFSREVLLFGNNLMLCAATLVVLLGTLLPLIHQELGMGTISVGEPFFNQMFTYLIVPFVFMLGIGPLSRWKKQSARALRNQLLVAAGLSIVMALLVNFSYSRQSMMAILGMTLAFWILVTSIQEVIARMGSRDTGLSALRKLTPSHWGMILGHTGFAVSLIGIVMVSHYGEELDVRMATGDSVELADYRFVFNGIKDIQGPNYSGHAGLIDVFQGQVRVAQLEAEKRFYQVQRMGMTEAGIDSGLTRDLFVALGEQLKNGDWALRVYVKPFVNWIWIGAFIMALGGVFSISDKRYRIRKKQPVVSQPEQGEPV